MKKEQAKKDLLNQFVLAIDDVGKDSELGVFLSSYQEKLTKNQLKGIEIPRFTDGVSKVVRKSHQGVPKSVTKLISMINNRGILNGFGLGLRML
ncbi:hypothetical protein [Weissella paramesenteroides]|uniref:hypothetical protein n=1 Tax=Weissella paramesenteroides TaxID=1249 RepID=UPI003F1ED795